MADKKAVLWVRKGDPKEVTIVDREGNKRKPNMEKLQKHQTVRGAYISSGRYAKGVGQYFYGGKLGSPAELRARGNKYATNDEIMKALGYEKTLVDI